MKTIKGTLAVSELRQRAHHMHEDRGTTSWRHYRHKQTRRGRRFHGYASQEDKG